MKVYLLIMAIAIGIIFLALALKYVFAFFNCYDDVEKDWKCKVANCLTALAALTVGSALVVLFLHVSSTIA